MDIDRRQFLGTVATTAAGAVAANMFTSAQLARAAATPQIKGLAFDAFTVFNPLSVNTRCEEIFPGKGNEFAAAWRTRMFEYSWLRCCAGRYADFWQITQDALAYTSQFLKLKVTDDQREHLMHAWLELKSYPDALAPIQTMKSHGLKMAFLANMTPHMLESLIANSKLEGIFDILSTDRIKDYKPSPRAYQMAIDHFKLTRDEIAYIAFGAWDAAGAKWFGYRTFWVNPQALPAEHLGTSPDATAHGLPDLLRFLNL